MPRDFASRAVHPRVAVADQRVVETARLGARPDGLQLSASPDERYAIFTRLDATGSDLLLVNNFR